MNNLIRPKLPRSHNRVAAVMAHTSRYAFKGRTRLIEDAGISRSSLARLLAGSAWPIQATLIRIARQLEKEVGRHLDCRELWSEDGTYPTPNICDLVGCPGCMPPQFYSVKDDVRARYANTKAGQWTGDNFENIPGETQSIKEVK